MKNFRKVLALVLVVATLFSMATIAGAKTTADYKDGDEVSYVEAVDVLSAIGILNGYEDETFGPTKNIRRDEMAKMVAVLSNAGDDVSDLYADACDFADCKGNWARSYIAYTHETGVVAGRNATTFDPTAKVTGLETAKMLLVVLGFDAKEQGYVGSKWDTNVLRDAKEMGLLNGFAADYNVKKAITREEAANMFLNALKAPMVVGYLSNNIVKITNDLIWKANGNNKLDKDDIDISLPDAEKNGWVIFHKSNAIVSETPLYHIYSGLKTTTGFDCYGRPATVWYIHNDRTDKDSIIGSYSIAADKEYTTYANLAKDYKDELASNKYDVELYINGEKTNMSVKDFQDKYTGNGVLTQVYFTNTDSDKVTEIVITAKWTYFGVVSAVSKYNNTFTVTDVETGNVVGTWTQTSEKVAVGDYVRFYLCNGTNPWHSTPNKNKNNNAAYDFCLHEVEVIEAVNATITYGRDYDDINASYFKAGETYKYNKNFSGSTIGAWDELNAASALGLDADIFLDAYGYVLYVAEHDNSLKNQVAFFVEGTGFAEEKGYGYDAEGNKYKKVEYTADAVVVDGEAGAVEAENMIVDEKMVDEWLQLRAHFQKTGVLAKYTVDSKGKFTSVAAAEFAPAGATLAKNDWEIVEDELFVDNTTKFLIRSTDPKTGDWTYEEIVGYKNLEGSYVAEAISGAQYDDHTNIQYFVKANDKKTAEYVFINALYEKAADNFFVMGREYSAWTEIAGIHPSDYYAYRALVDGVDSLVLVDKDTTLTAGEMYKGGMTYRGVTMAEDEDKNGNKELKLYVAADVRVADATGVAKNAKYAVVNDGTENWLYVYKNDGKDLTDKIRVAEEGLKVITVLNPDEKNEFNGYYVTENEIPDELICDRAYVYTNDAGEATILVRIVKGTDFPM